MKQHPTSCICCGYIVPGNRTQSVLLCWACEALTKLDLACRNKAPDAVEDAGEVARHGWMHLRKMEMAPHDIVQRFGNVYGREAPFENVAKE